MEEEDKTIEVEQIAEDGDGQMKNLKKKTEALEVKEESLKALLITQEEENKLLFDQLYDARKKLFSLQLAEYNQEQSSSDLGLYLQFQQLHREIESQERKIESLNDEIRKQGLTAHNNNKEYIELKQKLTEIEKQIIFGRKFISTQYFRHYFELPQTYKISYEDVRLDYERKLKIKESLETQKHKYEERKRDIIKMLQDRRNEYHELTRELEKLS